MKKCMLFAALALLGLSLPCLAADIRKGHLPKDFNPEKYELRQLVECTPRDGLPNFYHKIKKGQKEMNVVYLGGSITEQDGYRVQSCEYLQSLYPGIRFNGIKASIGGTGSYLGAMRCGHDVVRQKPDLVFIEFAVNDGGAKPASLIKSMEGIVRQIWKADPHTDIVFVYTVTEGIMDDALEGKMHRAASVDEEIADYYGIPSIHLAVEVTELLRQGRLVMRPKGGEVTHVAGEALNQTAGDQPMLVFSPDGVHPFPDTGHKLYTEAIKRSLPLLGRSTRARAHKLYAPMVSDCIEGVTTVYFDDPRVKVTGDMTKYGGGRPELDYFSHLTEFDIFESGSEISFKFKGSKVVLYDILGPEGVVLDVKVDDLPSKEYVRFDKHCGYCRLSFETVASDLDPDTVHDITIRVTDKPIDKRSILGDSAKVLYDKYTDVYLEKHYYSGNIFLFGDLL